VVSELTAKVGNWGRWGEADERGALNLLTPETVLAALRVCRTGKVYSLGLPVQRTGIPIYEYRGAPQRLTLTNHDDEPMWRAFGGQEGIGAHEDLLILASHSSTHMDALCHVYDAGSIYNGFPADGMKPYEGAEHCGIEKAGPILTRGVLLDVARSKGVGYLEPEYVITAADLEFALAQTGTQLRAGDVVAIRTGWLERFLADASDIGFSQPGIGLEAADWLASHDPVAVAADNSAVEVQPFDQGRFLAVHRELLVKRGVYLIEHVNLRELAEDGCYEFLFGVSPLSVTGATASPVNPFAVG
jgi:kynurenine formamidase